MSRITTRDLDKQFKQHAWEMDYEARTRKVDHFVKGIKEEIDTVSFALQHHTQGESYNRFKYNGYPSVVAHYNCHGFEIKDEVYGIQPVASEGGKFLLMSNNSHRAEHYNHKDITLKINKLIQDALTHNEKEIVETYRERRKASKNLDVSPKLS